MRWPSWWPWQDDEVERITDLERRAALNDLDWVAARLEKALDNAEDQIKEARRDA